MKPPLSAKTMLSQLCKVSYVSEPAGRMTRNDGNEEYIEVARSQIKTVEGLGIRGRILRVRFDGCRGPKQRERVWLHLKGFGELLPPSNLPTTPSQHFFPSHSPTTNIAQNKRHLPAIFGASCCAACQSPLAEVQLLSASRAPSF
jgi:hypothetical protein